ncbi:hypothetical protein DSAG12_03473 [Promethearchaeum syntrophicum]|uniref:Uncharacterized protein n=1 Tax=Promethearchaeum syntrophicum TaxID=2594042 RepID=A0A5B9DFX8_9ARCH|nr:hypothetical protein [Candidatus Prometheoarchaeum syntrophicum]QEE17636.1 hypothetical protein DSAG12_03473 [Candidatus Prometheoarchaeum syntrophicum]
MQKKEKEEKKIKKNIHREKREITKQGNFILSLLGIYFIFFGYICSVYNEFISEEGIVSYEILFLNRIFFSKSTWLATILVFLIIAFMAFRENFHEYALRYTHYLIIFTFILSFFWHWMAVEFDLSLIPIFFGFIKVEGIGRFEGYLSILIVIILYYFSAFVGCAVKKEYQKYLKKKHEIHINNNLHEPPKQEVK